MTDALRSLARKAAVAVAAVVVLGGTALAPPAQAAASIDLQPEDLARGADIAVAHIEDGDLVHGDRIVDVGGDRSTLIGRSGRGWLVGTSDVDGVGEFRVVRVGPDDSTRVIKRGISVFELTLSTNGRFFVHMGRGTRRAVPIRVFSARTGELKAEKDFANYPQVVGMDGPIVLLSSWAKSDYGIRSWDTRTDAIAVVSKKPANIVDLEHGLLATYTKDPYLAGCVRLTRLGAPTVALWKSCSERIVAFSPDGERMATVHILSDGLGPNEVQEREIGGTLLGDYSTNWFGAITFETNTDLLLEVNGDTMASTVRCSEGECENASDPVAARHPRLSPALSTQRVGSVGPR
ncbi:MAG: hypothetical protein JWN68_597 [Nocardioides sp.]|uniref:hypothetical protein n=1 Tax=Nocardioides sp. TaxID=35761 RepID=UPI002616901D|nr:hypothetical protein [Nocardioides sp.]MCW2832644.1 hypothetical protein [Nocardioides sp.]